MLKSFLIRTLSLLPILFAISSLSFLLMHIIPGDPTDLLLGEWASEQERQSLRNTMGLTGSGLSQYFLFLKGLLKFDLGHSYLSGQPVTRLILDRLPATLELTFFSVLFSCAWGIPAGVLTAGTKKPWLDFLGNGLGTLGMSIPGYFLGPVLIWVFAIQGGVLPVGGRDGLSSVLLPALSLALPLGAILMRMTRSAIKEVLTEDYIRVAYAKGLSRTKLYFKHALKNAAIPILTVVGLQVGTLLTGTVITETIFNWPGLGTLLFDAIQQRDYPIVQGALIVMASVYVAINFITDTLYTLANPKVQTS